MSLEDWNGESIETANSQADGSGTWFVADYSRNLIRSGIDPWPPPAIVQKLYKSEHGKFADPTTRELGQRQLGFYCDLQSLHSEDAITWSFFGPLAAQGTEAGADFLNWLCEQLDLPWTENRVCAIDPWRRVAHPKSLSPGGPELDFVLEGDQCVIFGEAKWFSGEGRHGPGAEDTQMHYRRSFLHDYGPRIYGERGRGLLGVALDQPIEAEVPAPVEGVETRALYWADLCEYAEHPCREEFGRYYDWKQEHMADAYKRKDRGGKR